MGSEDMGSEDMGSEDMGSEDMGSEDMGGRHKTWGQIFNLELFFKIKDLTIEALISDFN
jgi:hypothetical protein